MRTAELINVVYFSGFTVLALVRPLPPRSRRKAVSIGLGALLLTIMSMNFDRWLPAYPSSIIRDWMPAPIIAFAYWISGCFYQQPDPRLQAMFERFEELILRHLRGGLLPRLGATVWGELLEVAYVFCYPVVPLGLAALYVLHLGHEVDKYWTVLLLSAYPCYALLPFVQLKPPRLIERTDEKARPERRLRRLNLWLARHVTHQANTFPSGHVAASTAIALTLLYLSTATGVVFAVIALGIAAGCIAGRYHYAIDVGAAVLLSVVVFTLVVS